MKYRPVLTKTKTAVSQINKEIKRIMISKSFTSDVKTKKINDLLAKKNQLLKKIHDVMMAVNE